MKSSTSTFCFGAKLLFGLTWLGFASGLLVASWLFWGNDYEAFSTLVLYYVEKADWKTYFQQQVFPIQRFHLAQNMLYLAWLGLGAYTFILYKKINEWSAAICLFADWLKQGIAQQIKQLSKRSTTEKTALASLLGLLAIKGLFNIHSYDIQYDEAWTYNHFVSKGILVSVSSPNNNHIFYTILASLSDWLPLSAKYTMRLPNYIGGLGLALLFYGILRTKFSYPTTLIALAYLICSPPINAYMLYARGYMWMMVFALLALWITLNLLKTANDYNLWLSYILVQCLGVYSNPVYLYHFLPLNGLLLIAFVGRKEIFGLKQWLKANIWIGLILVILHLPLLATNGLSFLTNSVSSTNSITWSAYWHYLNRVADWWWWGQGVYLYWIAIGIMLFLGITIIRFWQKSNPLGYPAMLSFTYLLLPVIWYALFKTEAPYRAWCFVIIYIAWSLALMLHLLESYIVWTGTKFSIALITITAFTTYSAWQHYFINWTIEIDFEAKKIAQKLQTLTAKEVYSFSRYNKPLLQYYYLTAGENLKVYMPFKQSKDYVDFNAKTYQAVIWEKDTVVYIPTAQEEHILKQRKYQKYYENNQIILYRAPSQ